MITVDCFMVHPKRVLRQGDVERLAYRVLTGEGQREAILRIVFVDDRRMIDIHEMFLRTPTPTDVLSFPLTDEGSDVLEGEIYVNIDQAVRQAKEYAVTHREEAQRLVIHGILHLVGFDDVTKRKQAAMKAREEFYLAGKAKPARRRKRAAAGGGTTKARATRRRSSKKRVR